MRNDFHLSPKVCLQSTEVFHLVSAFFSPKSHAKNVFSVREIGFLYHGIIQALCRSNQAKLSWIENLVFGLIMKNLQNLTQCALVTQHRQESDRKVIQEITVSPLARESRKRPKHTRFQSFYSSHGWLHNRQSKIHCQ